MRQIDFAPLYRSTVGFDRLFDMLDGVSGFDAGPTAYPPYNIERLGENEYRITMAVAGFSEDELKIDVKEQTLNVKGEKKADGKERQFLHHGIATRAFDRRFRLADHVEVKGADLRDGLSGRVLAHRVLLTAEAQIARRTSRSVVEAMVASTPIPAS